MQRNRAANSPSVDPQTVWKCTMRPAAFANRLTVLICGVAAVLCSAQQTETPKKQTPVTARPAEPSALDTKTAAGAIIQMTNAFRESRGLASLRVNPQLDATANYFAEFMAGNEKYGHEADGSNPSDRAKKHGYAYCLLSENIAYVHRKSSSSAQELAQRFVDGWKNSEVHRENILDSDIKETGVAIHHNASNGNYYAVQLFGRPKSDTIRIQVVNQSQKTIHYVLRAKPFDLEPRSTRTHELCRPTELDFRGTKPEEAGKHVPTSHGDAFLVTDGKDGVRIQRKESLAEDR